MFRIPRRMQSNHWLIFVHFVNMSWHSKKCHTMRTEQSLETKKNVYECGTETDNFINITEPCVESVARIARANQ